MSKLMTTPPAEVPINIPLLKSLIKEQIPSLAHLEPQFMGAGWDNEMFRLGDTHILRIPRRKIAVELIENEQKWLSRIYDRLDSKIQIPVHEFIGKPGLGYPWPWSILPWLDGKMALEDYPSGKETVLGLVNFLKQLHILDEDNEAPANPVRGIPMSEMEQQITTRLKLLEEKGHIKSTMFDILKASLDAEASKEARWIHGDLHARNILVDKRRISAVIDWGDITSGDVATDLSCIWMLFDEKEDRLRFIEKYGMDAALVARSKGWALHFASIFLQTGLVDSPQNAAFGCDIFRRLEQDI